MTADPTLAVVRNEVDSDYEYHCDALAGHFDWTATEFSFADVNTTRVFENFRSLVAERTVRA